MSKKNVVTICLILAGLFLYWVGSQFAEQILVWLDVPVTGKSLWQASSSQDYLTWAYVHVSAILVALLALFLVYRSERTMTFFTESVSELQKVSYPLPKETWRLGFAVVVIVAICVLILGLYDLIWQRVILFLM